MQAYFARKLTYICEKGGQAERINFVDINNQLVMFS